MGLPLSNLQPGRQMNVTGTAAFKIEASGTMEKN